MKTILFFFLFLFLSNIINAQAPSKFNYQGVARDASGNGLTDQNIQIRISILDGSVSGTLLFEEIHAATTNAFGLFTLAIGTGTAGTIHPDLASLNWGNQDKFIQVEFDPTATGNYILSGTSQLMSVPYALHSAHADSAANVYKPGEGLIVSNDSIHSNWSNQGNNIENNNIGNVGIGITPNNQKLEVNGAITIGNTSNNSAGSIRYTGTDFEGSNGSQWNSLTQSSISYQHLVISNIVSSTLRNTIVYANDSIIVNETGWYIVSMEGNGLNPSTYNNITTTDLDYAGHAFIRNLTNGTNVIESIPIFEKYFFSNSTGTISAYIQHYFSASNIVHLNANDVLKPCAVVYATGTQTGSWTFAPKSIKLIKLTD